MDDATKRADIETRLAKARDDLLTAQDDLGHGHWRGATNRAYYAVFHVASAVLLWLDIERARHSGTQAAFNEFLVKPGKLEPEYGQIYSRARKAREEQDYDLQAAPTDLCRRRPDCRRRRAVSGAPHRHLREAGALG